jgi:hypothetical protein
MKSPNSVNRKRPLTTGKPDDPTVIVSPETPSPPAVSARLHLVGKGGIDERTLVMGSEEHRTASQLNVLPPSSAAFVNLTPANKQQQPAEVAAEPQTADKPLAVSRLIVSAYRIAGFGILSIILLGLASYLAVNIFYFVSTSWIVPTSLSAADEHVLQLDSIRSQESAAKGALETQRLQLGAQLSDARRIFESEQTFQDGFRQAMATDLGDRKAQLKKLAGLLKSYARSKASIQGSNDAFVGMQRGQLASQYDAHVIDRDQMVQGNFQMAQIAGANLALDAKHVEIDTQASDLERQVQSLEAAESAAAKGSPVAAQFSYEILHMKHEFDISVLASKKAQDDAVSLKMSLALLDTTIAQHDEMLETIKHSPYMMASDKSYTMAFVPYDNRSKVTVGTPVYSCRLGFVFCSKAGEVAEVVEGEIVAKHPLRNKDLRGVMVRLNLADSKAVEQTSLFVGGRPLGV